MVKKMVKKMPGYAKTKAEEMKKAKQKAEQAKEAAKKRQTRKKEFYILKERFKHSPAFAEFLGGFFVSQWTFFLYGSIAWLMTFSYHHVGKDEEYRDVLSPTEMEKADLSYTFHSPTYSIYGDMSYGQAVKNAYLWDDFRNGKGGLFQGICGLLSILIAVGVGARLAKGAVKTNLKNARIDFAQLEQLKDYGINANELIKEMEPFIAKLVSTMSEIDRGYFDNLLAGGLYKADYQTCVDIVAGHLRSHPEDYNELVKIIDENTLPESVRKKYGKTTISFDAAQAMIKQK